MGLRVFCEGKQTVTSALADCHQCAANACTAHPPCCSNTLPQHVNRLPRHISNATEPFASPHALSGAGAILQEPFLWTMTTTRPRSFPASKTTAHPMCPLLFPLLPLRKPLNRKRLERGAGKGSRKGLLFALPFPKGKGWVRLPPLPPLSRKPRPPLFTFPNATQKRHAPRLLDLWRRGCRRRVRLLVAAARRYPKPRSVPRADGPFRQFAGPHGIDAGRKNNV